MKINHIGFCLGQFDTLMCHDCPSLKKCLIMFGRDQAVLNVQRVLDRLEIEGKVKTMIQEDLNNGS